MATTRAREALNMEVVITSGSAASGVLVGDAIARFVEERPGAVLGLATGSSPLPVYNHLISLTADGLDLSELTVFTLDEYLGLPAGHPQTYRSFITQSFTAPAGIPDSRVHTPDPAAEDVAQMCRDYEKQIAAAGGIDIQILGMAGGEAEGGGEGEKGQLRQIEAVSRERDQVVVDRQR